MSGPAGPGIVHRPHPTCPSAESNPGPLGRACWRRRPGGRHGSVPEAQVCLARGVEREALARWRNTNRAPEAG